MTEERSHKQTDTKKQTPAISTNDVPQRTRRKLLKGTAAIPVVMTLYSGAALARTSNITGEADSIENAVFEDTSNGPQLVCTYPDPAQQQPQGGPYDLGPDPQGVLIDKPKINLGTMGPNKIMRRKMKQLENCHAQGGIMISAAAYTSIMSKTGITINSTW